MKDQDIEAKIDGLADMVVRGFTEISDEMTTKADLAELREEMTTSRLA